ncbi:MAG: hypothetical protein EP348_11925 [Alphaproteobacteria bacterium]|nr:MAG: hypothetical protein EP348_11925 [Alphaproteobacteria bacterium]
MRNFSTDAAGFAALTLSELILQQCVLKGLFSNEEAKELLALAARRHEDAAEGNDEKIALNMEAAHLLRLLASGLEPLFQEERARKPETPASPCSAKPAEPRARPNWVAFPD